MARRFGSVFPRRGTRSFYFWCDDKQVRLCRIEEGKDEAERQRARIIAEREFTTAGPGRYLDNRPCKELVELYLDAIKGDVAPHTLVNKRRTLGVFLEKFGDTQYDDVTRIGTRVPLSSVATWGPAGRYHAAADVRAWSAWLAANEKVSADRLKGLRFPEPPARGEEYAIAPKHYGAILNASPPWFADILSALHGTGCRPEEVLGLTADEYRPALQTWEKKKHKGTRKGLRRTVKLNADMVALTERLTAKNPSGLVFRGRKGGRVTVSYFGLRLKEIALAAGIPPAEVEKIIPYSFRHRYAIDLLEAGVSESDVAALLGHKGTRTLLKHYAHTLERVRHKGAALAKLEEYRNTRPAG